MRIGHAHSSWAFGVLLATGAAALLYAANFHPQRLPIAIELPAFFGEVPPARHTVGGTPLGLVFGSVAFLIFLFASALGIRKKRRTWPIGHVQLWLKAHIWLSIFTLPLVLLHCGFQSGGTHTTSLVILYVVVMGSGFYGLALQQFMPRLMKERLPREVVFEQIPHLRALLFAAAATVRGGLRQVQREEAAIPVESGAGERSAAVALHDDSAAVLAAFLDDECLPYLAANRGDRLRLGESPAAADRFRTLKLNLASEWHATVEDLEQRCRERRQMDLQTKLQHWLHAWLLIHVPASFALLVFTAWHAWVALRFLVVS